MAHSGSGAKNTDDASESADPRHACATGRLRRWLTFPSCASFISIITPRREPVSLSITTPVYSLSTSTVTLDGRGTKRAAGGGSEYQARAA